MVFLQICLIFSDLSYHSATFSHKSLMRIHGSYRHHSKGSGMDHILVYVLSICQAVQQVDLRLLQDNQPLFQHFILAGINVQNTVVASLPRSMQSSSLCFRVEYSSSWESGRLTVSVHSRNFISFDVELDSPSSVTGLENEPVEIETICASLGYFLHDFIWYEIKIILLWL